MDRRRTRLIALGTGVVAAVALTVVAAGGHGGSGRSVAVAAQGSGAGDPAPPVREPTTAPPSIAPPSIAPPSTAAPSSAPPSPTAPPSTAPPATAPPATTPDGGEDLSPGTYRETADTGNYLVHPSTADAAAGSATSVGTGTERLRLDVLLSDDGAAGTVTARLVNVSGRAMRFPGGLHVVAEVTRNGAAWRTFDLVDGAVTGLAPGQQATVRTSFSFDGPGQYATTGSTVVDLV